MQDEQALLKESASYIDEAIEMGAVRVPRRALAVACSSPHR